MKVLANTWITNQTACIGFVLAKDEFTGKVFTYVGAGWGFDKDADIAHVLAWGTKMRSEVFYAVDFSEQEKNDKA